MNRRSGTALKLNQSGRDETKARLLPFSISQIHQKRQLNCTIFTRHCYLSITMHMYDSSLAEGLEARQTKCSRKGTDIKPPTAMILSGNFVVWSNDLSATVIAQNKSQQGYKWTEVGTFFFFSLYFPLQLLVANCNVKRQAQQSTRSCSWSGGTTASSFPFQIRKVAQELNSNLYLQRMDG